MDTVRVTDRYTLDRQIGHGGSGAVWLGRDEVLGRTVALKRIGYPPGSVDVDLIRAEREARLAARVNHPNVVAVFDLVETPEDNWLVMEYVAGTTLAATIDARGPLSPDRTAQVLTKVADALAAAHAAGIVHRDVKPSNILLGDDDSVKLTDFGIARAVADASLTQTGLVTGSPAYLSPEVASGRSATQASDVWSLGATMFHCLAGHPPYEIGDNVMGAMYRIVHEEPPRLRTAGWLAPLLEITMSRDPAHRPSMAEVRDYLRAPSSATQVLAVPPPTSPPPSSPPPSSAPPTPPPPSSPPPSSPPPPPAPPSPTAVAPAPSPEPASDRKVGLLAALGGLVAVLAVIGVILLLGQGDDSPPSALNQGPSSEPPSGTTSSDPSSAGSDPSAAPPTAAELEDFARTYIRTASTDPSAGFRMLTASYQRRSPRYTEFWGSVSDARVLAVSGDPARMQVTYTYRYRLSSGGGATTHTDKVTLILVQKGDQILIADATFAPA